MSPSGPGGSSSAVRSSSWSPSPCSVRSSPCEGERTSSSRTRASAQHRLEQPHEVVGRGLGCIRRATHHRSGCRGFEYVHRKLRKNKVDVTEPHNLPLQFATETGLVGLALFAGAMERRSWGSGGAATMLPRLPWGSPYRRTCSMVSSTTTGTSSRCRRRFSSPPASCSHAAVPSGA